MGKKQQKNQQFFKVLLTRNIDSRELTSLANTGFETDGESTISILKETNGSCMALIVKGNITGNRNLMFESTRPLIDSIVRHSNRKGPNKPNKRQRKLNRERNAKALSNSAPSAQTKPETPESPPTTSPSTTDSAVTTPEKPSPMKPIPDIIPAQPTQMRSYFTHDYMRRHQQEQQPSQQQQQPHQQPQQQQPYQQPLQQCQQQTEQLNGQQHSEYRTYHNQHFNVNGYYGHQNQHNNDQYVPYDPRYQLYVHTNQSYSIYPEYTPSTNTLLQTAQPHDGVTGSEKKNTAESGPTGNGGDNPMQHGSTYQPESENTNTGGVSNQSGKPSTYCKQMNCLRNTKRMNEEYDNNLKNNKSNTIGKKIKMTDNDQSKPNYEDISDNELSPTIEKMTSGKKIEEIPPAQETEDYPESVLKSAGLPKLDQQS